MRAIGNSLSVMLKHAIWASVVCTLLVPTIGHAESLPSPLHLWRDWVWHDQEYRRCPFYYNATGSERDHFVCSWPGRLDLSITSSGGQFTQRWKVYEERQWIPLPGDEKNWPQEVTVDGRLARVVLRDSRPVIRLDPEYNLTRVRNFTVAGSFAWDKQPGILATPEETGLLALTVDGDRIAWPRLDRNMLWLGKGEETRRVEDAIQAKVFRRISDQVPTQLDTIMEIEVAGSVREELFGPALPNEFVPFSMDSELPARLEPDGNLRVQVWPGSWRITLRARGPGVLESVSMPKPEHNLPEFEVWSYQANNRLRVTVPTASHPVDPEQASVPEQWRSLPGFRMTPGGKLTVAERSRGKIETDNVLDLQRMLWMDFDGQGFVFSDEINGIMRSGWRMEMAAPYALMSATEWDKNLVVTEVDGNSGVEVRRTDVDLDALGRAETRDEMPVTGWQSEIDTVSATLHLPPGHKLLAATGVDQAPSSWSGQWKLLDFFLLLIVTTATARLFGWTAGIVALVALTLTINEPFSPVWSLLNLLAAVALVRVAPPGRLRFALRLYRGASFSFLLVVLIPFAANQIRTGIYPQLEESWRYKIVATASGRFIDANTLDAITYERAREQKMKSFERLPIAGLSRDSSRNVLPALSQTGPGLPNWDWVSNELVWSGPVNPDRTMRLLIVPDWLVSLLRFVAVGTLGFLAAFFAFDLLGRQWRWRPIRGGPQRAPGTAILLIVALLLSGFLPGGKAHADIPTPEILRELEKRLLEPPDCTPHCAEVVSAEVKIDENQLGIEMEIHAFEDVAVALPGSADGWLPELITVGDSTEPWALRDDHGVRWTLLKSGRNRVSLSGPIPPVDSLEIPFAAPPRVITAQSDNWFITGIENHRLVSGSLHLSRLAADTPAEETERWETNRFPDFVKVERTVNLDSDWHVTTVVDRIAPETGALNIKVPLLEGESIVSGEFTVTEGSVLVAMRPDQKRVRWNSALPRESPMTLFSAPDQPRKEVWRFVIGNSWNVHFEGVPESESKSKGNGVRVAEFYPRPGETLLARIDQPKPVPGNTLAFDNVTMATTVGAHTRDSNMTLRYRSTRGSQHVIGLPKESEVTAVEIDGVSEPLRAIDAKLSVPILPGEHSVSIDWKEDLEPGFRDRTPSVDVGASASNITMILTMPANRWILFTHGPRVGPAILYWSELVALIIAAAILGRIHLTPLRTPQWVLLGLGFSTFSWSALAVVVAWLFVNGGIKTKRAQLSRWPYNLSQIGLAVLSLAALGAIVTTLPNGLLGTPDMHVTGYESHGNSLSWFADQTDSATPIASVWSLPLWTYKALILAWSLWLSFSILRWLPWVWDSFSRNGLWHSKPPDPELIDAAEPS